MAGLVVRLAGITAHYRDPRYNTGAIGKNPLPIATLHSPPPCTMHGMLCAAKGGWVDPADLVMGWRMDFDTVCADFQTCKLPQRKSFSFKTGMQKLEASPRVREFLSFPRLTIAILSGGQSEWFRSPANPLLFGRSEDLATTKEITDGAEYDICSEAIVARQCLPIPLGSGPLYSAPLYFESGRTAVAMSPKIDARSTQQVRAGRGHRIARLRQTGETFFVWDYRRAAAS